MDRAPDFGSDGWGFESLRAHRAADFSGSGYGIPWCRGSTYISGALATVICSGYANTHASIHMCELGEAANAAQRYEGGGKIDWALPSKDELNAPCYYYTNRDAIGGFINNEHCWSSSQYELNYAWQQDFTSGNQNGPYNTFTSLGVRVGRPQQAAAEVGARLGVSATDQGSRQVLTLGLCV